MQVVKVGTAVSMGAMAAFLVSLKQVHPSIELRFGVSTILAFVIAGAVSWRFCEALARSDETESAGKKRFMFRWMTAFIGISSLGTILAFAYALKDVSAKSRGEVVEGTLIAVVVLAAGGWLIYKAFQFFEEQSAAELDQQRRDHEHRDQDDDE